MDGEELEAPKGSILKLLQTEELEVYSIEALQDRIMVLQSEVKRSELAIDKKMKSKKEANSIFR